MSNRTYSVQCQSCFRAMEMKRIKGQRNDTTTRSFYSLFEGAQEEPRVITISRDAAGDFRRDMVICQWCVNMKKFARMHPETLLSGLEMILGSELRGFVGHRCEPHVREVPFFAIVLEDGFATYVEKGSRDGRDIWTVTEAGLHEINRLRAAAEDPNSPEYRYFDARGYGKAA